MTAPPLTHHEILALVEPLARRGRHVDLAATDRIGRKVVFKPIDHPGQEPGLPGWRETLELESYGTGSFRLCRVLAASSGGHELKATLQARGADVGELLSRFDTVGLDRHLRAGPGYVITRSYEFHSYAENRAEAPALSRGVVHVEGLTLAFDIIAVRGSSADLTLQAPAGELPPLPEDLLAVIGWNWARLVAQENGRWTSRMRLRGSGPPRTAKAERGIEQAAVHLARVLTEAPPQFHDRFLWARWGAVLRRMIPTLAGAGMVGGVMLLPRIAPTVDPGVWLALHYAPIAIMGLAFTLQELPRFEVPAPPRRLAATSWQRTGPLPPPTHLGNA
jgi:hypothetical protein